MIKPFTMALLGWVFFKFVYADWVEAETATEYIAGMILLGVAPCTAVVYCRPASYGSTIIRLTS